MNALVLDQNNLYILVAVLVAVVVIFAIARGRSVKLWFRKAGLQVGEAPKAANSAPGAAGTTTNVANHAKISGSSISVHVGNSTTYSSPATRDQSQQK